MAFSSNELQEHVNALSEALGKEWTFAVLHNRDGNIVVQGKKNAIVEHDKQRMQLFGSKEEELSIFKTYSQKQCFAVESFILGNIDHPFIIKATNALHTKLPSRTISMAYHPFGNLFNVCQALDRPLTGVEAWFVFEQVRNEG